MWWMVVAGVLVVACGGRSHHEGDGNNDERASAGTGGTVDASGGASTGSGEMHGAGSGGTSGGSGGTTGGGPTGAGDDGNTAGAGDVPPVNPREDSPECKMYQGTDDVLDACNQSGAMECPADFASAVAMLTPDAFDYFEVRVGCGLTSIVPRAPGLGGNSWTFDANGKLVGYFTYGDTPYGPCGDSLYKKGLGSDACNTNRDCAFGPDATLEQPCLCPCPDSPPADGVVESPLACVYVPSPTGFKCPAHAYDYVVAVSEGSGPDVSGSGTVRRGCSGWTEIAWSYEGTNVRCVYDDKQAFAGAERDTPADAACPAVKAWRNGEVYPACSDDKTCVFGMDRDPNGVACTNYPFIQ